MTSIVNVARSHWPEFDEDIRREYPFMGQEGVCAKCGHALPPREVMDIEPAPWPCPECDCGHVA